MVKLDCPPPCRGIFIVVDGMDGTGKSSCIPFIREYFESLGREVVTTREPGGTPGAEKIRQVLLHEDLAPATQELLAWAARYDHVSNLIIPALQEDKVVISDRFWNSTLVYQRDAVPSGMGLNKLNPATSAFLLQEIESLFFHSIKRTGPTLTFLFDADVEVAYERRKKRDESNQNKDIFESKGIEYYRNVKDAFLRGWTKNLHKCIKIDANGTLEDAQKQIKKYLDEFSTLWSLGSH